MTVNIGAEEDSGRNMVARRDIVVVIAAGIAAALICAKLNVNEALLNWSRPFERLQVDELPAVLLVIAVGLIWFSLRRYFEANRQLRLRRTVERRLAETLADNKRLAQQYVDMQEYERKALARDLHDELGQYLNAIKLDAVSIRDAAAATSAVRDVTLGMIANIDRVYGVVAGLIRQLRPVGFDDLGVAAALEHCVNEWRTRLPSVKFELSISGDFERLDETRGLVLYRLVQEALTNIARHAHAAHVQIRIAAGRAVDSSPCIDILIADDGAGADMTLPRRGLGLVGMRERAAALGGSICLTSERGAGFRVDARLPMEAAGAASDARGAAA